jgi:hypothetical protein
VAVLFKRGCSVTIAKPEGFFTQKPNAVVVSELRVQFVVEKTIGSEPNMGDVTMTNLAEQSRGQVVAKPLYVRLDAGYDGALERVFTGDLLWGRSTKVGADWETALQLRDGDRAFRFARVTRSYRGGVSARDAVVEAARAMGLTVKLSPAAERELGAQFASGLTLSGTASTELSRLLGPFGMSWSIQDGRLQVLRADELRADQAVVVSEDTGMIGVPELGPPLRRGGRPVVLVKMQLYPRVTPGGKVRIESRTVRGTFKALRIIHTGDTHGESWETSVEGEPV